jgi:hypothetical protein
MSSKDYLPGSDRSFLQWVFSFLAVLFPSLKRFDFPEDRYQTLASKRDVFANKLIAAESPATRTKGIVQEKNEARKDLEQEVRQAVRQFLTYNLAVTNKDRDDMGLPVHKTTRIPSPVATTYPQVDVDSGIIRRLYLHFFDLDGSKARPPGQHGVEIRWAILDSPPRNIDELINSSYATRPPFVMTFTDSQRGKTVYFCICWLNTRSKKGPWSEIHSAVIP